KMSILRSFEAGYAEPDLHSRHFQRERFVAGEGERGLTTIAGQDYSSTALIAKRVANRLNTKNDGLIRSRFVD
ncbi:hypothetical protein KAX17_02905, partial [Candidatus Bipolaricaulota bacterium]|nr:hypothetical protein [Candidatus Bipolaricaulota bacterium]